MSNEHNLLATWSIYSDLSHNAHLFYDKCDVEGRSARRGCNVEIGQQLVRACLATWPVGNGQSSDNPSCKWTLVVLAQQGITRYGIYSKLLLTLPDIPEKNQFTTHPQLKLSA